MFKSKNGKFFPTFILFMFLLTGIFIGCQKDDSEFQLLESEEEIGNTILRSDKENTDNEIIEEQVQIQIGEQRTNPYSVVSMQAAFDFYNTHVKSSAFKNKEVQATHQYIKVLPTTEEHLQLLDELDNNQEENALVLQDYPLDYEILGEGDFYVQPKDESDIYHPIYTVIPVDYILPSGLPFEVLEDVYQPTEEEYDVETASLVLSKWDDELIEDFGKTITLEELPNHLKEAAKNRLFGRRYRPHGWVMVENNETNTMDPLMHAKISIGRGIWWRYTHTDENGYFRSPKKYRGKVRIRAKWRSHSATIRKSWNELLGIQVSDHLMTIKRSSNGRTKNIWRGSEHLWYKGTVHNGIARYNIYADLHGITPIVDANVWAWKNGSGNASAPMLFQYRQLPLLAAISGITQGNLWSALVGGLISIVPSWLRPDMLYNGLKHQKVNGTVNTGAIQQVVFHESSHFSHAKKAGATYWSKIFASELRNSIVEGDPYHDGASPTAIAGDDIAVAEGWATFMEYTLMEEYYEMAEEGGTWITDPVDYIEDFNMFTTPMNPNFRQTDNDFFLTGVMWDVTDNSTESGTQLLDGSDADPINFIVDQVDGYNAGSIFSRLDNNVRNLCDLRDEFPNNVQINDLFESYGCDEPRGGSCLLFTLLNLGDFFKTSTPATILSENFGIYQLRDNFMTKSEKGSQYIQDFYRLGELVKTKEVELSFSAATDAITFLVSNKEKISLLNNTKVNANAVLYNSSEAKEYIAFIKEIKSESSHPEWTSILEKLEGDIQLYKGQTIAAIEKSLN